MNNKIKITLPLIETLKRYKPSWLKKDFLAGATIAAIAIPQGMAYAQLAGVQLAAGLYAALVAMIIFAFFSTSRYVNVGPDAAMAALAGATVLPIAYGNPAQVATLVAILAILIGVICLIAVAIKLSYISELLSRPIMVGYMSGLALVIIGSQAPKLFGLESPPPLTNFFGNIVYIFSNLSLVDITTLVFSLSLLVISLVISIKFKRLPGALIILIGATLVSIALDFPALGIEILGNIPKGLPIPDLPSIKLSDIQGLVVPAIAISFIAYANTITIGKSLKNRNKKTAEEVRPNQEFIGLGAANLGSGIFGGIPVSGSGSRSAINFQSNAKSQVSQLFGAALIAVALVFLTPFLSHLPNAALAVIIITAVVKLFNLNELKTIWHGWQSEAILAIATIVGVVFLGVIQGLLLAIFLAIMNLIRRYAFPKDAVLGVAKDLSVRDISKPPKTTTIPGLLIYRFDAPLFFGNASYFHERVISLINESEDRVEWLLWDAETITSIDSTAALMLVNLREELKARNIILAVSRLKGNVREDVKLNDALYKSIHNSHHYTSLGDGIAAFYERNSKKA